MTNHDPETLQSLEPQPGEHVKKFFFLLEGQPGFRSRLSYADTEYFNLSAKDSRIAKAKRKRPVPSIEQIRHVITSLPSKTVIEKKMKCRCAV